MRIFSWAAGSLQSKVPAQDAGEELERIRTANDGNLDAGDVVTESRPEDAPLHQLFEWDDAVAAEEHRKNQARQIIRSVRVETPADDRKSPPKVVICYVSPAPQKKPGYRLAEEAMADPVTREQVLNNALAALAGWKQRYADLEDIAGDLAGVAEAIDEVIEKARKRKLTAAK